MAAPLRAITLPAPGKTTASLIFLHGLGDSGHGWAPVAEALQGALPFVRCILPHAPSIPISLNGGARMPGWYDLSTLDPNVEARQQLSDLSGIQDNLSGVRALIQKEVDSGIPPARIILGGFSQGGALSLLSALTLPLKIGGFVGLSTYLPVRERAPAISKTAFPDAPNPNLATRMFLAHGTSDGVVQFAWGRGSWQVLQTLGFSAMEFKSYPGMAHSSSPEEIQDLTEWLKQTLK